MDRTIGLAGGPVAQPGLERWSYMTINGTTYKTINRLGQPEVRGSNPCRPTFFFAFW